MYLQSIQKFTGCLLQVPADGLQDLLALGLGGDPDPVQLVDLQVLDGHAHVPVDGRQRRPDLTAGHPRHHLGALGDLVDLHSVASAATTIISLLISV